MPSILVIIPFMLLIFIAYTLLKAFVFDRLKISKWIILTAALLSLVLTAVLRLNPNSIGGLAQTGVTVILAAWFFQVFFADRTNTKNKKTDIKIRPKAKPNRVKNRNQEGK